MLYDDKMAKYYDLIFDQKKYEDEVAFIKEVSYQDNPVSILDVGCGTGTHSILLAQDNITNYVVGIDESDSMIKVANIKSREIDKVSFYSKRLRELDVESFDIVISMFNVINHISDIDKLFTFFYEVNKKVKSGGSFIFDCWNGVATYRDLPTKEKRVRYNNGSNYITTFCNPEIDLMNSCIMMNNKIEICVDDAVVDSFEYKLRHTIWTPKIIQELLARADFDSVVVNKFFINEKATPTDYKVVYTCRSKK